MRQSRSSRISQELVPLEERKSSIFKVTSAFKDPKDSPQAAQAALFSKEKSELLAELDKRQQEQLKRAEDVEQQLTRMQERLAFLSVLESKSEEKLDSLCEQKVDISAFH